MIEKSIRYAYADEDNGYWRINLPRNVIPFLFKKPFKEEIEEMEKEKKKLEKDKKTKKPIKRYASYEALIDNPVLAAEYWEDRWQNASNKNDFKNSYDYMKWSLAFEDQPFHRGGIASLIK